MEAPTATPAADTAAKEGHPEEGQQEHAGHEVPAAAAAADAPRKQPTCEILQQALFSILIFGSPSILIFCRLTTGSHL